MLDLSKHSSLVVRMFNLFHFDNLGLLQDLDGVIVTGNLFLRKEHRAEGALANWLHDLEVFDGGGRGPR